MTIPVFAQASLESSSVTQHSQPHISEIHFTEDHSSQLPQNWQFYPNQFITEPSSVLTPQEVQLPASFKDLTGSNIGYGTFIGHFKIPSEFIGRRIAVHIPAEYGAYRIYIDGKFILRHGEIAKTAEEQRNERAPRIGYFVPESEYFTMSIQASNYTHLHGGIEQPIRIGTAGTINRQYQQLMMSISIVCGLVLGVGFLRFFFQSFGVQPNAIAKVFLSLACSLFFWPCITFLQRRMPIRS